MQVNKRPMGHIVCLSYLAINGSNSLGHHECKSSYPSERSSVTILDNFNQEKILTEPRTHDTYKPDFTQYECFKYQHDAFYPYHPVVEKTFQF
jgi:hypothetical protein